MRLPTSWPSFDAADTGVLALRRYIRDSWTTLRRSHADLVAAAADEKVAPCDRPTLYVSRREEPGHIAARLGVEALEVRQLPPDPERLEGHGLLYLPHPYVVPGGRFNEMFGWDSYFIAQGLLLDGEVELARGMTDNCLYEVEHYGTVLNANRTYYLSRSQPPLLGRMVVEVFEHTRDLAWLERGLPAVIAYHAYWMREPRWVPSTGLSRYHGTVDTPAPEVVHSERDARGLNHYDRVREYFRGLPPEAYDSSAFYDRRSDTLTPRFYLASRAMYESGFDPSARFGPFCCEILSHHPVELNCLLYQMEVDIAWMLETLGRPGEAREWTRRARERAGTVHRLMWSEARGLYLDYDFERGRLLDYPFITTFFPLWTGMAPPEAAARVVANLPLFECAGGLRTSTVRTGNQWDAPFGWAPMQVIAVQGLRRYGFHEAADRISLSFLRLLLADFAAHGTLKEKYDVEAGRAAVAADLRYGYTSNEVGFGWTNAAFLQLAAGLGPDVRLSRRSPGAR